MKKLILVACLLLLVGCGYFIGYLIYTPKIRAYVAQIDGLNSEVYNLTQITSKQEQTIDNQETLIASQQTDITILENEVSTQKQKIDSQEVRITGLEYEKSNLQQDLKVAEVQISNLNTELSNERTRLNDILNISVTQNYQWEYQYSTWSWNLPITLSTYVSFWERSRPHLISQYVNMAKDPADDVYIDNMVKKLNEAATQKHYSDIQKLNYMISLIQSLPYTVDSETTPADEYPRYPIETLFDRGGDCEDTSILVAALLDSMGYDVVLLHLEKEQHMAVGIHLPSAYGTYYEYKGKKYYYLETTGDGWEVGEFPTELKDGSAYIYPLRSD